MKTNLREFKRDAQNVQAWLVGNGIASLAAAVYLMREGNVPGPNIHILDLHPGFEGEMATLGDAENGYFLPYQCLPHFHGACIESLLSLVPGILDPDMSLLGDIREFSRQRQSQPEAVRTPGAIKLKALASDAVYTGEFQVGLKHRLELIKLLLESEKTLASKKINEAFDKSFFDTGFWLYWSTTYLSHLIMLVLKYANC